MTQLSPRVFGWGRKKWSAKTSEITRDGRSREETREVEN
jgi:hypothetical protein